MGILRKSGIITQSTALAMHNDNYHYTSLERYENHMGTFDSVMIQYQVGNGTATSSVVYPNHKVDCSSGVGAADSRGGYASVPSIKPKSQRFDFSCKIQGIVNGATATRNTVIGVVQAAAAQLGGIANIIGVFFIQLNDNTWAAYSVDSLGISGGTAITDPVAGDTLQIKGYKTRFEFLINGVIVVTTDRPFAADEVCYPLVYCASDVGATVARKISVDYISWEINP